MDEQEYVDQELLASSTSVHAYIAQMKKSADALVWVWRELMNAQGRARLKRMFRWLVVGMMFSLVPSWLLGLLVDDLAHGRLERLWILVGCMGASLVCAQTANTIMGRQREWAFGYNMGASDKRMTELFFAQSVGQHVAEGSRLSAENLESARGRIRGVTDMLVFQGMASLLRLAMSYTYLYIMSPLAGCVMTLLLGNYLIWTIYLNRKVMTVCTPIEAEFRRHNRHRGDVWNLVVRVKHSAKEKDEVAYMDRWFGNIIKKDRPFWLWYHMPTHWRAITEVLTVSVVLGFAVWQISHGHLELSVLVPLFMWSLGIAENLWQIGQVERVVSWNMPAVRSMMEALTVPPAITVREGAPSLRGEGPISVELQGISHTYDSHERGARPVLRNVSLQIRAGERVALVGMTGSGKSTITRLLMRDFDPDKGRVLFNGDDLRDLDLASVLSQIGHIPQKPPILDGTIRHNILYALTQEERATVTDADIWAVLERVQLALHDRFREGLDTRVGKTGVKLSGGEQQRLMIAAALIQHVRFVIIDEATSSLDALTERRVQAGIEEILREGVTALVIAHRFSTIRFCDRIIFLRSASELADGEPQIAAVGTFDELLESCPAFRELAQLQDMAVARAS